MIVTAKYGGSRTCHCPGTLLSVASIMGVGLLGASIAPGLPAQGHTLREIRRISAAVSDLSDVGRAAVGPDGAIWLEQYEDGVIVGFAPNASTPTKVGRLGEGPGDFRAVTQLFVRPNDLWVVDWRLLRSTSFDPSGRVNSTTIIGQPKGLRVIRLQAASPAGATWWTSIGQDDLPVIMAIPADGDPPLALLQYPIMACVVSGITNSRSVNMTVPLCHTPSIAFAASGDFGAEAEPLAIGDGRSGVRVLVVSAKGDTVLDRQLPLPGSPIPRAIRDSVIKARLEGRGALAREIMDRGLVPRVYSPLVDLRVSDAGDVVVDVVSGPRAERHLAVLRRNDPKVVMLPIRSTQSLLWFGGNRLLMTDEDENGLQDVVLYEIVASS
jgi:hypothetical protein